LENETYPLYLECGRQISPQIKSVAAYENPGTEIGAAFKARVQEEGRRLYPPKSFALEGERLD
jgi:hypothetical protein